MRGVHRFTLFILFIRYCHNRPNTELTGTISEIRRQVDLLIDVRLEEEVRRRVIVDAKCWCREINVADVEAFKSMMRDAVRAAVSSAHELFERKKASRAEDWRFVNCFFVEDIWCREGGSNPHDRKGRRILSLILGILQGVAG